MVHCTYVGGLADDRAYGIAVDGNGFAYVTGSTTSGNFPVRNALQSRLAGGRNAFVLKLSLAGSSLVFSTYLSGNASDNGNGIAFDAEGNVYVVGDTTSTNFPATGMQRGNHGGQDACVAKIAADGSRLLYSTYLGGESDDRGAGIAVDASGSAYITGSTYSADFPLLHAVQTSRRGSTDAFVTKVNASGTLVYSTYLGGSGVEVGNAIAVDSSGSAYLVGYSYSTDLAVTNALQAANAGDCDAFLAKLSATGDSLAYLSYLGGNSSDTATAVALSASGNVYVAGWTLSTNFPLFNPYQSTNAGNYGAFVTKMIFNLSLTVADGCSVTYNRAQNALSLLTDAGAAPAGTIAPGSSSQQNSQCVLNGSGSSVSTAGTVLTLNLALTFLPAFNGNKNIYMQATSPSGSSNWQALGTWTVPAPSASITAVSVTPASGSGASQTFGFLIFDQKGVSDVAMVWMQISTGASANSCYSRYDAVGNNLYLLNDANMAWYGPVSPGSVASLQNSQCTLSASGSSVMNSGTNMTVSVALSFKAAFAGTKALWVYANSATINTGRQNMGSWVAN